MPARASRSGMALEKGKTALRRQATQFAPCCILIDNAERLYDDFNQEAYREHMPLMQGLLREIAEKPYYNFLLMAGISNPKPVSYMQDPVKSIVAQGRAIALGGKLAEFDPCNVGAALPARLRGGALAKNQGFVGNNGEAFQIVVPLAELEQ